MGRKKIAIKPIAHPSTRRATFEKRRIGLLKKAMELSILCKSTVSLTIYTADGEVYVYASEPYENVVQKFQNYRGPYRLLTNDHLQQLVPGKSASNGIGYEIIKQQNNNMNTHVVPVIEEEINNNTSLSNPITITNSNSSTTPVSDEIQYYPSTDNNLQSSHSSSSPRRSSAMSAMSTSSLSSTVTGFNHMQLQRHTYPFMVPTNARRDHSNNAFPMHQSEPQNHGNMYQMQSPRYWNTNSNGYNMEHINQSQSYHSSMPKIEHEDSTSEDNDLNNFKKNNNESHEFKYSGKRRSYAEMNQMTEDDLQLPPNFMNSPELKAPFPLDADMSVLIPELDVDSAF